MNRNTTVLASASRTATPTVKTFYNPDCSGVVLVIDVTAVPGAAPSLVVTIQGYDATSGKTWNIIASAAITGVGTTLLRIGQSLIAVANATINDMLPSQWTVSAVHGNANAVTYSIGASITDV